ncbi:DegV family protein with EDD domain [Natranaerovirga hydrolytica]|uniref:DegV family protein with EDD domain n=1 Tax=Natranaerovirga hydrolytica TaxID=680378 RepID=A0A4R1MDI3_9FIRM|nr:DegV family protein [Natranaerovirga hydrolytica]TCK90526.1 DegV family protein with EDD domain [Natranaerovirga hydrolytica]
MSIQLITDSNCDLPKEIIQKYNIEVLPQLVYLDEVEYLDGVTLEAKKLFDDMRAGKVYKTSQLSPNMFVEVFTKYVKEGQDCMYVGFSSNLSGTYQASEIAKEEVLEDYPDAMITTIDTKCASMGFGLVVYQTALMIEEGLSKEAIINKTKENAEHMEHIFTVDNLEYLYRGGRVSRTSAFVGGLLNIKPILNVEDGKLIPIEKVRGRSKVFKRMLEIMKERGSNLKNQTIGISHGDDLEAANKLKDMIKEEFGCEAFIINNIGCSVGAHSGPGTLALYFSNQ